THRLLDVIIGDTAMFDGLKHHREVIAFEHDVRNLACHVAAPGTHSDTNIGSLESRAVIDAIPGHGYNQARALQSLNDAQLVPGTHSRKHMNALHQLCENLGFHLIKFSGVDDLQFFVALKSDLLCDSVCRRA